MQLNLPHVRIVDLDSTISDDMWRLWLIDPTAPDSESKYHAYHCYASEDKPINRYIVDESPAPVVLLTARPEYLRQKTVEWLERHGFDYSLLLMRANDDHRPSAVMKKELVENTVFKIARVERAFDDREDVIEMYQSIGIKGVLV